MLGLALGTWSQSPQMEQLTHDSYTRKKQLFVTSFLENVFPPLTLTTRDHANKIAFKEERQSRLPNNLFHTKEQRT